MNYSGKELGRRIAEYFKRCQAQGVFPDEAGLLLDLKLTRAEYDGLRGNVRLARYLEDARLRRESIIARDIYACDGRQPAGKLFLAKQTSNGGLCDKPPSDGALTVNVLLNGGAAGEDTGEFD